LARLRLPPSRLISSSPTIYPLSVRLLYSVNNPIVCRIPDAVGALRNIFLVTRVLGHVRFLRGTPHFCLVLLGICLLTVASWVMTGRRCVPGPVRWPSCRFSDGSDPNMPESRGEFWMLATDLGMMGFTRLRIQYRLWIPIPLPLDCWAGFCGGCCCGAWLSVFGRGARCWKIPILVGRCSC
jgi:hypothetical protein